jgi:hypothetical protein
MRGLDTVGVWGSNPHAPTNPLKPILSISFAVRTTFSVAPKRNSPINGGAIESKRRLAAGRVSSLTLDAIVLILKSDLPVTKPHSDISPILR